MAKSKAKESSTMPTQEEFDTYEAKLASVQTSQAMGLDTKDAEDDLRAYMLKTGIANEFPVTDFPELNEPDPEPDKL